MKKAILTLVTIVCLACAVIGLVACNGGGDLDNLTGKEQCAKVLNAFIDYFVPEQSTPPQTTAKRRGMTSADSQPTVDDILTKTLTPSSYDGAQRLSLPLTYSYFLTKLCENQNFVIGDKPVEFVATETPGYPMTCIVQFSYDENKDLLTLYLYDGRSLMYCEIYYDEQNDTIKDFTLHGNKIGASGNASGIEYYEYVTIKRKGNDLKEGDTYFYPESGDCLLQGVAQDVSAEYGAYHVGLLDDILNDFMQKAESKEVLSTDFGEEMRMTSQFARGLTDRLLNSGSSGDNNVTEEQWLQAFDISSFSNFTATWTNSAGDFYVKADDGVFTYIDGDGKEFYYSIEDKAYYKYQEGQYGDYFDKITISQADYESAYTSLAPAAFAEELKNRFPMFRYEKGDGNYVCEDINIRGDIYTLVVTFENGKVKSIDVSSQGQNTVINFTYDSTVVNPPSNVGGGGGTDRVPVSNIYFDEIEMSMLVGENIPLILNIEPANATDKTISWKSTNPHIVSVDEEGNLQSHEVGASTITAMSSNGLIASIAVRVDNRPDDEPDDPISITLSQTHLEMRVNDAFDLDANILPITASTANVKWSSNNSNIAWVDERGVVTALEEGSTTIMATTDNGLTAECTVTISGVNDDPQEIPIENITISPGYATMYAGGTITLTATIYPENATNQNFTWGADSQSVEIVDNHDGTCTVRALQEGNVNISAMTENGIGTTCNIDILSVASLIRLDTTYIDMTVGETATVNAIIEGDIQDIKVDIQWMPGNDMIARIESSTTTSCTVRALEAGESSVTAVYFDSNGNSTDIGTCSIHVNPSPYGAVAGKTYMCYDVMGNVPEDEYAEVDKVRGEMAGMSVTFNLDGTFRMSKDDAIVIIGSYSPLDSNVMLTVSQYTNGGVEDQSKVGTIYNLMLDGSGYVMYINTASGGTIECHFMQAYA